MLLKGKGLMMKHKAALTLVLRGPTSIQVHAKGSDQELQRRLLRKKLALAFKLKIPEGALPPSTGTFETCARIGTCLEYALSYFACSWKLQLFARVLKAGDASPRWSLPACCTGAAGETDWKASHPEYISGAAEVRQAKLLEYERAVEELKLVFKRKLLEQQLEQESSGKNANNIKKRVAGTRE